MWSKFIAWVTSWFKKQKPVIVTKPPDEQPQGDVWPSYRFDKYFGHGYPSENDDRIATIAACRNAKLDCIRCIGGKPSDEVAVHLLHFRSPVDNEFKLGKKNWYEQAKSKGIIRYQIVIETIHAKRWADLTVDYPLDTVQFMATDVVSVQKIITNRPVVQLID